MPRSPAERARAWVEWFGVARLAAAAVATIIVCAGGVWLVRTPPPATEASLPRAAPPSVVVSSTSSPQHSVPTISTVLLVHVAGAVEQPGVYEMAADARVRDAIVAAGGPAEGADWDALNLAAALADGAKLYVPMVGEDVPASVAPVSPHGGGDQPVVAVDVNAASASDLESLPGVGPATATAIVVERERNGPFLDVEDLVRVPGIGPAKLDALRDLVTT